MGEKEKGREAVERTIARVVKNSAMDVNDVRKQVGSIARREDAIREANPPRGENPNASEQARGRMKETSFTIPLIQKKDKRKTWF